MSSMVYFTSKDISAIVLSSVFWFVLNITITPIFWEITRLPFLCDVIGAVALIIAVWWTRKIGIATMVGIITTLLTLLFRPAALQMLGFATASIIFDILTKIVGYEKCFKKFLGEILFIIPILAFSTFIGGLIIGKFFMTFPAMIAIIIFGGLHAIGGIIGAIVGIIIIEALKRRKIEAIR
ncbi:MAG: hypothetical protein QW806_07680 [Nitrososphaerota archaeon]